MTKEVVEDASGEGEQEYWFGEGGCHEEMPRVGVGEGEQEYWFGEGGCHESSKMKIESGRDCCWSGSGINLDQN